MCVWGGGGMAADAGLFNNNISTMVNGYGYNTSNLFIYMNYIIIHINYKPVTVYFFQKGIWAHVPKFSITACSQCLK